MSGKLGYNEDKLHKIENEVKMLKLASGKSATIGGPKDAGQKQDMMQNIFDMISEQ